jgi:ammonium transporter Rh
MGEGHDEAAGKRVITDNMLFAGSILALEAFCLIIYAIWFDFVEDQADANQEVTYYPYTRDVCIMIFFGFGFLMAFLRRAGFTSIGYSFLIAALVCQYSIVLENFFFELDNPKFNHRRHVGVENMLNGLFCSGACLISFGAFIGKVTPLQLMVLVIVEPFFYWLNFFIGYIKLEAVDIGGGMWIHTFGCYFGLAACWWLTSKKTHGHPDNCSCYSSDIFAYAGTLFLWMMWPSFNGVLGVDTQEQNRAFFNTFISLCSATAATFVVSRLVSGHRFECVHIQNSTLAGGVVMGVAAGLDMNPSAPVGIGFVTGIISVLGYRYLTPLMSRMGIQDICGIHNLHGMPGVLGSMVAMWATLGLSYDDNAYENSFPHGRSQAGIQAAATFISIGLGLGGGFFCGFLMWLVGKLNPVKRADLFNDRGYWHLPSDYEYVVVKDDDDNTVELDELGVSGSHIRALKNKQVGKVVPAEEGTHPRFGRTGTQVVERRDSGSDSD